MQTKKAILAALSCVLAGTLLAGYLQPEPVVQTKRTPMQNEIMRYTDQMRPMQALLKTLETQWSEAHAHATPSNTQLQLRQNVLPALEVLMSQMQSVSIQETAIREVHEELLKPLSDFVESVRIAVESPPETFAQRHRDLSPVLSSFLSAQKVYRKELLRLFQLHQIVPIGSETMSASARPQASEGEEKK